MIVVRTCSCMQTGMVECEQSSAPSMRCVIATDLERSDFSCQLELELELHGATSLAIKMIWVCRSMPPIGLI